jgi:hypothetical protein
MGECKDCKWWEENKNYPANATGECEYAKTSGAKMFHNDLSGDIVTRGDFGCNQFEAK